MAKPRIVVCSPVPAAVAERMLTEFDAVMSGEGDFTVDEAIAKAAEHKADALVFTLRLKMGAEAIARLPQSVKVLSTYSVGYEHIDVAAAVARGLTVTNTPDVLTDANADMAMMLMLCACRRANEYSTMMRNGWRTRAGLAHMLGRQVTGRTLGIVGMGRIGQAVAQRARGFEMKILYHNRRRLSPELEQGATYFADLKEMLPHSEILSLHLPGGQGALINRETLGLLPPGAVLVNEARGDLVDEDALIEALQSGRLAAAGLDVFQSEPDYDLRLRDLPNVFLTPHMGSATLETRTAMGMLVLDNILNVLAGQPQNIVIA